MTAIAIGRTLKSNFIVVDGMVQQTLNVKGYKECVLKDKITNFNLSKQFLVVLGEELISYGANFLNSWCEMKRIQVDLCKTEHFLELLICADRSRSYTIDIMHGTPVEMDWSDVYIASSIGVKWYQIRHDGTAYKIAKEEYLEQNLVIINYRGEKSEILPPNVDFNVRDFAIDALNKEHHWRKTEGKKKGRIPLDYDFEERFSSVEIPTDKSLEIVRDYPFIDLTDQFLSYAPPVWDYALAESFKYSPNLKI